MGLVVENKGVVLLDDGKIMHWKYVFAILFEIGKKRHY